MDVVLLLYLLCDTPTHTCHLIFGMCLFAPGAPQMDVVLPIKGLEQGWRVLAVSQLVAAPELQLHEVGTGAAWSRMSPIEEHVSGGVAWGHMRPCINNQMSTAHAQ